MAYLLFILNFSLFISAVLYPTTFRHYAPLHTATTNADFVLIVSGVFTFLFFGLAQIQPRRKPRTPPPEKQTFGGRWFHPGEEFLHIGVVGPTGRGKTVTFYLPSILAKAQEKCSLIITDPKGELYKYTAHYLKEKGKKIYVFKPLSIPYTHFYNPLEYLKKEYEFLNVATAMLMNVPGGEKSDWVSLSAPLLASSLQYASALTGDKKTLPYAVNILTHNDNDALAQTLGKNEKSFACWRAFSQALGSERTAASIKASIVNPLRFFASNEIGTVLSASQSQIHLEEIRKTPTALFLIIPETESREFYPITALLFQQVFKLLYAEEDEQTARLPVYLFADELANIGTIPDFPGYISTARSREVSFFYGLQSISQLKEKYEKGYEGILNSTHNKILMSGLTDPETYRYLQTVIGKVREEVVSLQHSDALIQFRSQTGHSHKEEDRAVLTENDVRTLSKEEFMVLKSNERPGKCKRPFVDLTKFVTEPLPLINDPDYLINFDKEFFNQPQPETPKLKDEKERGEKSMERE